MISEIFEEAEPLYGRNLVNVRWKSQQTWNFFVGKHSDLDGVLQAMLSVD